MHTVHGIDKESVVKLEVFLLRIYPKRTPKTLHRMAALARALRIRKSWEDRHR